MFCSSRDAINTNSCVLSSGSVVVVCHRSSTRALAAASASLVEVVSVRSMSAATGGGGGRALAGSASADGAVEESATVLEDFDLFLSESTGIGLIVLVGVRLAFCGC